MIEPYLFWFGITEEAAREDYIYWIDLTGNLMIDHEGNYLLFHYALYAT